MLFFRRGELPVGWGRALTCAREAAALRTATRLGAAMVRTETAETVMAAMASCFSLREVARAIGPAEPRGGYHLRIFPRSICMPRSDWLIFDDLQLVTKTAFAHQDRAHPRSRGVHLGRGGR